MKNLLTIFLSCLVSQAFSQIILESAHVIPTGRQYIMATDNKSQKLAPAGPNQNWNYASLNSSKKDTTRTGMPFWHKGFSNFPQSNYATINSTDNNTVNFYELNDNAFYNHGVYASTDTSLNIVKIKTQIFQFPGHFQDAFNESDTIFGLSLELGFDPDTAGPMPFLDSLRISTRFDRLVELNGWGKLTTPIGTFDALRQNTRNIISQFVMIYSNGNWISAPKSVIDYFGLFIPQPDTVHNVIFMTNSGAYGAPLLTYSNRNKDTSATMKWLFQTPTKSSVASSNTFELNIYPNPCSEHLKLEIPGLTAHYKIVNVLGQVFIEGDFQDNTTVDIQDLSEGIYYVQIESESGTLLTRKIIVTN